jgi:hypothetical protein
MLRGFGGIPVDPCQDASVSATTYSMNVRAARWPK